MKTKILVGDVRRQLDAIPSGSVHSIITSPPYWGLRSYHGGEGMVGCEPTFREYLDALVAVFREARRVLRDDGQIWINCGDAYSSGGKEFPPKNLMMMPARVAIALQEDGWYLRSEIIWHKPNPMPESVRDRPTCAHEKVFLLTKNPSYFYDADAVRSPKKVRLDPDGSRHEKSKTAAKSRAYTDNRLKPDKQRGHSRRHAGFNDRWDAMARSQQTAAGAALRNVWKIPTQGYSGDHFATFPPKLVELCIKAGTSDAGVCTNCGAPFARIVEIEDRYGRLGESWHDHVDDMVVGQRGAPDADGAPIRRTVGWEPSCECWVDEIDVPPSDPAIVLDPFGGAGTTALVANRLGRDAILIELSPEYAEMARQRLVDEMPLFASEISVQGGPEVSSHAGE